MPVLSGRVAIVTGGGQGVGRGIALALASEGVSVIVAARTRSTIDATADEVRARGAPARAIVCDVSVRSQVESCVAETLAEFGAVDILVNGAQTVRTGPVRSITEDDLRAVWQSGFIGTLNFMQVCHPHLKTSGGCVVNFGTGASLRPDPVSYGLYASVKEAVRMITRTAAVEWGPDGIRVNCVIPFALSPGLEKWMDERPEEASQFIATVPLGRVGDSETDIGRVVTFLVGPDARYVTGVTLTVDGGQAFLR
jgi:NAD(P)-dependent dehydrogenase (short-subunit alcohol dehydrogenase family)